MKTEDDIDILMNKIFKKMKTGNYKGKVPIKCISNIDAIVTLVEHELCLKLENFCQKTFADMIAKMITNQDVFNEISHLIMDSVDDKLDDEISKLDLDQKTDAIIFDAVGDSPIDARIQAEVEYHINSADITTQIDSMVDDEFRNIDIETIIDKKVEDEIENIDIETIIDKKIDGIISDGDVKILKEIKNNADH